MCLLRFNFTLKHIPETKMEKMDGLNRRLGWIMKNNNKNQKLIKKNIRKSNFSLILNSVDLTYYNLRHKCYNQK